MLNGNVGVMKSMMAELTDESNMARAVSLISVTWAVGGTLGSGISSFPLVCLLISEPQALHWRRAIATTRSLANLLLPSFLGRIPIFLAMPRHRYVCCRVILSGRDFPEGGWLFFLSGSAVLTPSPRL